MYRGFPLRLVSKVRCPADGGELKARGNDDQIRTGSLDCIGCGTRYSVEDGILDLMAGQPPVSGPARREILARDREAAVFDRRHSESREDMEIPSTLAGLDLSGRSIVDLGCGTGRITSRVVKLAGSVIAVDFSQASLRIFAEKLAEDAQVGLVLSDAVRAPLAPRAFDVALSTQVIEHIPRFDDRSAFLSLVGRGIRSDGVFVCTVYHHDLRSRLGRLKREGVHESGISYRRFTRREIEAEVGRHFEQVAVHPIKIAIPYVVRLPLPWGPVSRVLERVPLVNKLGHLLRVVARKARTSPASTQARGHPG
jgi:SAM-dependent methyltransferase